MFVFSSLFSAEHAKHDANRIAASSDAKMQKCFVTPGQFCPGTFTNIFSLVWIPFLFMLQVATSRNYHQLDSFVYSDDTTDDFHDYISAKVAAIRRECGEVCITEEHMLRKEHRDALNSVTWFKLLKKDVNCRMLFKKDSIHDRLDVSTNRNWML